MVPLLPPGQAKGPVTPFPPPLFPFLFLFFWLPPSFSPSSFHYECHIDLQHYAFIISSEQLKSSQHLSIDPLALPWVWLCLPTIVGLPPNAARGDLTLLCPFSDTAWILLPSYPIAPVSSPTMAIALHTVCCSGHTLQLEILRVF